MQQLLKGDITNIVVSILKKQIPSLQAVYLFGSFFDGIADDDSDIDIAFLAIEKISNFLRWEISKLVALALQVDVDLINLRETDTIFRYQILSTAERIYGNGYDIEFFETLAYSFYLWFQEERKPILDRIYMDKKVLNVK